MANFPSLLATSPEILPREYNVMLAPFNASPDLESTISPRHWACPNKNKKEKKLMENSCFIQSKTINKENGYNISSKTAGFKPKPQNMLSHSLQFTQLSKSTT